jgi:hypothetical protein
MKRGMNLMANVSIAPFSIDGTMFKRTGAWFGVFQRGSSLGEVSLFLGTLHGMSAMAPGRNKLIDLFPIHDGKKVPFTVESIASELTIVTRYGNIRLTYADKTKLLAQGDPGMGLLLEKTMEKHETVHPRKNGAWEAFFRMTCAFVFKGLEGSGFDFNDGKIPWNWETISSDHVYGQTRPSPDGTFTLYMEEFIYGGVVRDEYPTYADAKASMEAEWNSFISVMPKFPPDLEEKRERCEYTLWSYLTSPYGTAKYPMIQMFAGVMASQWQMCQNAVALQEHTDLAVDLLLGPIDRISPEGQLTDMYDDSICESLMVKPPMHGWAVKQIMKNHDLLKESTPEKVEKLYAGMGSWANWWLSFRDEDEDGLPSLIHSDETGLDDCTLFVNHLQVTSPDTSAYLVILFEAVGDLAQLLGKPEAEANAWYQKSKDLLQHLIDILWDGKHFAGLVPSTGEKLLSGSIVHYLPLVLGNRLPKEIIDQLVSDLLDPETFLSEYGLASENMTSDYFSPLGFGKGIILPPAMIYICTGLWETHRKDEARLITQRYCTALSNGNFPFFINPLSGAGAYMGCSWSNCAYTILSRLLNS